MHSRSLQLPLSLLVLVIAISVCSLPAWAQSTSTGTVAGSVTDQSNAIVVGATVTLTDKATNIARTATTNSAGRYIFVDVPPGMYAMTITKAGFATTKMDNQQVTVGVAVTVNAALQVGGSNVVVEVQANANELQTMNATVGNTVTAIAIDNLPSIGRDVNTFIELQPGVGTDGAVAGAVNDQSFFSLDGGNNSNDMDGNGTVYTGRQVGQSVGDPTGGVAAQYVGGAGVSGTMPTPADSVEEFKVNTAGQTADFNSSAGAEIKVVTKRGTNAFHGTAYEYYKDNNWSGNTWENTFAGVSRPSYHYSRFGGAIGGPLIPMEVLGGKTYFFFNYEGFRFPESETIVRSVPSPALQLGLLTDSTTGAVDYNLNNVPVTYNGTPYAANYGCAAAPGGLCDPLGLGLNSVVSQIWSKYEPASNVTGCQGQSLCDGANIQAFSANLTKPISSKFAVGRIDHDFGSKQHFMASYRYYNMKFVGDEQVDIGGFFPGDTKGTPASVSSDPVQNWYLVAGLTTNITSNTTNDFHYSYLRNWWAWSRGGAPPQVAGLGGALEFMSGQSASQDLGPFNVNNQQIRRRFWDGHDQMFRDDLSMLKGNHLLQFGGYYQRNFDYHQRNDSGGAINAYPVYSLGDGTNGSLLSSDIYACGGVGNGGATTSINNCGAVSAAALGMVSIASQVFTRSGSSLTLNPPLSNAFDKSTVPYYNVYFSDTWHIKPTLTLSYGLGWALEMPPTEADGKQTVLVDQSNEPVSTTAYLDSRKRAALAGQVYNPILGFALVGNTGAGLKYPYNPFYGEFSPRFAIAWSPKSTTGALGNTVVRFGYGRQYGRTNGVDQVLVPLLGLGLEQPVACNQNLATGTGNGWACGSSGTGTPSNAFRIGLTSSATGGPAVPLNSLASPTLPQPTYPGFNNAFSAAPEGLDPSFRPNAIDSFNLTVQKQLSRKVTMELGYIGRRITHEFQPVDLNTVPYMMTVGGQQFKDAYKNMVLQFCGGITGLAGGGCAGTLSAVTPQPFFENSMNPTYCAGFTSCTAAVANNEAFNIQFAQVWSLWSDLDNGGFNPTVLPRSMMNTPIPGNSFGANGQVTSGMALNASIGYGNYNAGFASLKVADWKGLTMQSNFTYSKALGTGAFVQASSSYTPLDAFNLDSTYGRQGFDRKFTYNVLMVYQPPFYKGQSGMMGRLLGGWTFASIFTAGSGTPNEIYTPFGDGQSFGGADGVAFGNNENAVPIGPVAPHSHAYYNSPSNGLPVNEFKNGVAEAMNWRVPVLGLDNKDGGVGILNGLPYWNMDVSIKKNVRIAENISLEFQGVFSNILNHNQWLDPTFNIGLFNPGGWGALPGEAGPRNIEIGARVRF